jgi:anti-sigma factor RsiW
MIELDAYLTSELDAEATVAVEHHLKQCSACSAELLTLQKENALYQNYRSTVEVSTGAWSEAQARMTRSIKEDWPSAIRRISLGSWWIWAAAASILLVTSLSLQLYERHGEPGPGGSGAKQAVEARPPVAQAVKDYQQALALLQAAYAEKKPELDPQLVHELDRNLELTRVAINECERALKEEPNNRQAVEFLLLGYEKQMDILRQITEAL